MSDTRRYSKSFKKSYRLSQVDLTQSHPEDVTRMMISNDNKNDICLAEYCIEAGKCGSVAGLPDLQA